MARKQARLPKEDEDRLRDSMRAAIEAKGWINRIGPLCVAAGLGSNTLGAFLNGETNAPNYVTVEMVARFLGLTISEFVGDPLLPKLRSSSRTEQAAEMARRVRRLQRMELDMSAQMAEILSPLAQLSSDD